MNYENLAQSLTKYRKWLIAEIEAELDCTDLGLETWRTSKLEDTYDDLVGSMYNGIMWKNWSV